MTNALQTCLEIYHPEFRRGYQDGRCLYFRKAIRLTENQRYADGKPLSVPAYHAVVPVGTDNAGRASSDPTPVTGWRGQGFLG